MAVTLVGTELFTSVVGTQPNGQVAATFLTPPPTATDLANFVNSNAVQPAPQIVVAAGSNSQAGAQGVSSPVVVITTVSATTRAIRLSGAAGAIISAYNAAGTTVKVYPPVSGKINALATNANYTLLNVKGAIYVAQTAKLWKAIGSTGV